MAQRSRYLASVIVVTGIACSQPALARSSEHDQPRITEARGAVVRTALVFPGRLEGMVTDERGAPLPGAAVSVQGSDLLFAVSDREGRYSLNDLRPGAYLVRAQHPGHLASKRTLVQVLPAGTARQGFRLRRLDVAVPMESGDALNVLAAAVGTAGETRGDLAPVAEQGEVVADPGGDIHEHTPVAWRLRHLKRSVLRDATGQVEIDTETVEAVSRPSGQVAMAGSGQANWSLPFAGQVNLITTSSFDSAAQLFSEPSRTGVTHVAIGAPAGRNGSWAAQGAMAASDLSSWVVGGSYTTLLATRHTLEVGASFSTQEYTGGNLAAIEALSDGMRYVGSVHAKDRWSLSRKATLDYGLHYGHYGYLERGNLASPSMALRLAAGDGSWVRASVSRTMRAPGAEEFVPAQFAGMWLPPQRTFAPLPGTEFTPQETRSVEVAFERQVGAYVVSARGFHQQVDDQIVTVFDMRIADRPRSDLGHYFTATGGDARASGWGVAISRPVASRLRGSVEYTVASATWLESDAATADWTPGARRRAGERLHDLTASLETDIPETLTRVLATYKLNSAFAPADRTETDPGLGLRFDMQVSQRLPFMGFTSAEWEFLVAVRNLFYEDAATGSIFDELLVVRPPKRIVGGVLVRF